MGRAQVSLRLSEAQKAQWDEYVDNDTTTVNTKTELIRQSVSQFIATDGDMGETPVSNEGGGEDKTGEILEAISGLENRISDMGDRLGTVEEEVRTAPERSVLTNDVFDSLPEDGSEPLTFEEIVITSTGDLSAAEEVREILERLAENTGTVKSQTEGQTTYYWKNI